MGSLSGTHIGFIFGDLYGLSLWVISISVLWGAGFEPVTSSVDINPLSGRWKVCLKGVFAKNERGYRLTGKNDRWQSLLILLLSIPSIRRKIVKTTHTEERSVQIQKVATFVSDRKKINLIPDKSFRYYKL